MCINILAVQQVVLELIFVASEQRSIVLQLIFLEFLFLHSLRPLFGFKTRMVECADDQKI